MSRNLHEMDCSQAGRTVAAIREALAHKETACVAQVLEIIQEMSDKADRLSVQDLAGIIGRDLTTVAKVMQAANCLGYNPGAVDITTLAEAIIVIGFEKIRNLAISLLLLETAEQRVGAAEAQGVAAQALSSALTAQVIIQRTTGINPDQAFVCGALRHYGQLLLSTFLPDDYRDALDLAQDMPLNAACTFVFGLAPIELGRRVLLESRLPKIISHALGESSDDLTGAESLSDGDRLLIVSEFSSRLSELIGSPGLTSESFEAGLRRLLRTYSDSVGLAEKELMQVLGSVEQMLSTFGRAQGMAQFSNPFMSRLRTLANGGKLSSVTNSGVPSTAKCAAAIERRSPDPVVAAMIEVQRLASERPFDVRRAFGVATRAIKAALRLRSCLVFLQEPGSPVFAASVGSGAFFEAIRNQPLLDPHRKDVFTVCLARGEDVLIQNPDDPRILPFIPNWFQQVPAKGPFVLLPVTDSTGTFAIICGTAGATDRIELTTQRRQQLKTLRSHFSASRVATGPSKAAA